MTLVYTWSYVAVCLTTPEPHTGFTLHKSDILYRNEAACRNAALRWLRTEYDQNIPDCYRGPMLIIDNMHVVE